MLIQCKGIINLISEISYFLSLTCLIVCLWRNLIFKIGGLVKLKIVGEIQRKYRERNKLFLALDIFLSILMIYFAVRVLFISISGLVSSNPSTDSPTLLIFAMLFTLGLSSAVRVVEMLVIGKKEYLMLLLFSTIFVLSVSVYILLLDYF